MRHLNTAIFLVVFLTCLSYGYLTCGLGGVFTYFFLLICLAPFFFDLNWSDDD